MADLIDRQAALKKLAVYIHLIDKTMGKGLLTDDDCMEAAKSVLGEDELPAVQPATSCSEIPNGSDGTISRQAAIDALDCINGVEEVLRSLPTVQPDHNADIGKKAEGDCISRQTAIDAVIDEFKRSPTPAIRAKLRLEALPPAPPTTDDWVPVKKRLPAVPWCRCLITRDDGRGGVTVKEALFSFGRWYDNEWLEDGRNRKFNISESVIAWAPFPAPYRGGEQDDR